MLNASCDGRVITKNCVGPLSHTCTVVHSKLMVGYSDAVKIALKILTHRDFLPSFFLYNQFHKILRLFDVLLFFLLQVKQYPIITYKHGIYELPHKLPNDLRLRILGNYLNYQEISGKYLNFIE